MTRKYSTVLLVALLLGLLSGCTLGRGAEPPALPGQQQEPLATANPDGVSHFANLSAAGDLTVGDDATITDALTAASLTTTAAVTAADLAATDDLTVADDSTFSGLAILGATTLAATTSTLTPASSFYHLDTTGNVTITLAACTTNGQILFLYGDDANNILIADTNVRTTTGSAITIAQYDLALFLCDDTEWIQLALATDS